MQKIARLLIAEEVRLGESSATEAQAAIRVCQKVGGMLVSLAGARGSQSLLARALALGAREAAWLGGITIRDDGTLATTAEVELEITKKEAAVGGVILVTGLLNLLETFLGEAMTLRLVRQIWPGVSLKDVKNIGSK